MRRGARTNCRPYEVTLDDEYREEQTLLYIAAQMGHTDIVRLLIESGESIDEKCGPDGDETPLYAAACFGKYQIVELLLEKGADAELLCHGETPLAIAMERRKDREDTRQHTRIIRLLRTKMTQLSAASQPIEINRIWFKR